MQMQTHFTHSGHHYPHINYGQQFGMQIARLAWLYLRSELIHSDPFRSKTNGHAFRRPMSQLQIGFFFGICQGSLLGSARGFCCVLSYNRLPAKNKQNQAASQVLMADPTAVVQSESSIQIQIEIENTPAETVTQVKHPYLYQWAVTRVGSIRTARCQ